MSPGMRGKRVSSMRMPTVKPYWLKPPRTRPVVMGPYSTPASGFAGALLLYTLAHSSPGGSHAIDRPSRRDPGRAGRARGSRRRAAEAPERQPVKIDVFPHCLPRRYFERAIQASPAGPTLQKRMTGIPVLVDVELRLRIMDRYEGYV